MANTFGNKRLPLPFSHRSGDQGQTRFNEAVVETLGNITQGVVDCDIVAATIAVTATRVPHKLGRPWTGWFVVDRDADCRIWRVVPASTEPRDDSKYIYLQANAGVNAKVYLF
jgi:hypothetical protein